MPFPLYKRYKYFKRKSWERIGLKTDDFESLYQKYIYCKECELCGKVFDKPIDRQMDHCHLTGEFRNIICKKCNSRKSDNKPRSNTSGEKLIYKAKEKPGQCKQGFRWEFCITMDGKKKTLKKSIHKDVVIDFRDKWLEENPDYYT